MKRITLGHNDWYNFNCGVQIADKEIEEWVNRVLDNLIDSECGQCSYTASGNTIVFGVRYEDQISIWYAKDYNSIDFFKENGEWDLDEHDFDEELDELTIEERLTRIEKILLNQTR